MNRIDAINETEKMWTWLYKHPAHDELYYVKHVAKMQKPWKNNCPVCELADGACSSCIIAWDNGTFCTDPESPYSKWQATTLDNPDYRTLYAGDIIAITRTLRREIGALA